MYADSERPEGLHTTPIRSHAGDHKWQRRTVIVGGGAAGIGAAGAAKGTDPAGEVVVYTEFEDAAYSPCGIPYVHGKEIPDFERLFLARKEHYVEAGHRHPLRDHGHRHRPRAGEGRRRGPGRRRLRPPGGRHRVRLRRPGRARRRPRRPLLRQEHPPGHGVGQGPRRRQDGRGRRGDPARPGDGHRAGPPRHRDPPGRPRPVGPVRRWPTRTSPSRSRTPGPRWASQLHFNTDASRPSSATAGTIRAVRDLRRRASPADLAVVVHQQGAEQHAGQGRRDRARLDRRHDRRRTDGHLGGRGLGRRRLHRDPARRHQRAAPGPVRQPRLRAGQGGRHQRRRRERALPARLRALGHGRRQVDDRRRLLRRDAGRPRSASRTCSAWPRASPGPATTPA